MPEPSSAGLLLAAALLASLVGMGWLALAMPVHAQQAWGRAPPPATQRALRIIGALALGVALLLCLQADHPSMAVLVWVMAMSAAAALIALVLAWHPRRLRLLAPWVRAGEPVATSR